MSTLYAAKVAAKTLLEGWPDWPDRDPEIRWVAPTKAEQWPKHGEVIAFTAQVPVTVPAESLRLGRQAYDEECTLRLILMVERKGDDPQAVEERADELYDQIVLALGSDPTLNGTVNRLQGWTVNRTLAPTEDGWLADFVVEQVVVGAQRPLP